jgi:phosphomannomutase
MGKYFGTDGFRGEAGITLTADHAYKVGRFLGWYYNALRERNGNNEPARIVIGKDTRRSSYMFEYSLVAGLTASGADAYLLHVTTTPSVAYIARVDDFDCGIMISASHNPYYDNGIKLIYCYGEKMPEETLLLVEDYIDGKLHVFDKDWPELPFAHREHIGCTVDYVSGRNRYMGYLISLGIYSFKGVKVGLDCANGASWNIAKSVFDALGADTYVINNKPNGTNINNNAGSTHIEGLQKFVVENHRYLAYNADDFSRWAMTVGSMTEKAVAFFLESGKAPEQGYKACASLKRLQERYGSKRLEMACERVMAYGATPSIRNISSLLMHGQEPATTLHATPDYNSYGITRGAAYYSKGGVKK